VIYDKFLEQYLSNSLIIKQKAGFDQINKLMMQARKELDACKKILDINRELAYTCAYSAMLYAARALMLLKGYRPSGINQHKTVVEFIGAYVGEDYKVLVQKFDNMRKRRNLLTYEPWKLNISMTDTKNAVKSTEDFLFLITNKIKEQDPQAEFKF
jgi:uncharacterized protein (UPF0332 family)